MLRKYLTDTDVSTWKNLIGGARRIVLFGHVSPDGDAMGATLALAECLKSQDKNVSIVVPTVFPEFLSWLPGSSDVLIYESANHEKVHEAVALADLAFCLDFSGWSRLESLSPVASQLHCPYIVVDHHLSPEVGGELMVSDPQASSTCEILTFVLCQVYGLESITHSMAQCLYCGMMTDTGGFTFNSSRSEIFYLISILLEKGIDKDKIYRRVYHTYSEERLRLEGYVLNEKMICYPEEHAAVFCLTREEMHRYHFHKGDAEGLVNKPLLIKDMRLSISLREDTEKPLIRVSLRSVDDFPCNRMAGEYFNGGGHLNASGGSLAMTMDEALAHTRKAILAYKSLLGD